MKYALDDDKNNDDSLGYQYRPYVWWSLRKRERLICSYC